MEGARRATGTSPSPRRSQNETTHMSSSNPSKGTDPRKRRFLTAEKKFQVYLEAQDGDKPVGELLRREGLYPTDLARIRQQVKEGAIQRLGAKPGRKQDVVSSADYEALKRELLEKERALAGQSVELVILRKKTDGGSWDR